MRSVCKAMVKYVALGEQTCHLTIFWNFLMDKTASENNKGSCGLSKRTLGRESHTYFFGFSRTGFRATRCFLPPLTSHLTRLQRASECPDLLMHFSPQIRLRLQSETASPTGWGFTVSACHALISRSNELLREMHGCDPISAYC